MSILVGSNFVYPLAFFVQAISPVFSGTFFL